MPQGQLHTIAQNDKLQINFHTNWITKEIGHVYIGFRKHQLKDKKIHAENEK